MKLRIITGLIGGIIIALVTYLGGIVFDLVYLLITCIAIFEVSRLFKNGEKVTYDSLVNYFLVIGLLLSKYFSEIISENIILLLYVAFNFVLFVVDPKINLERLSRTVLVGMYIVLFMYHMMLLNGTKYVWLVYIIAFGTDTFAYFTGVFIGKHKLCPNISPKKTIEGAIGGVVGCTILTLIYFNFLGINKYLYIIIFSIIVSIFSMIGDLFASKIKREYGVKDFGKILPGHGGIMDRFDSLLFVAPVVYYFVNQLL